MKSRSDSLSYGLGIAAGTALAALMAVAAPAIVPGIKTAAPPPIRFRDLTTRAADDRIIVALRSSDGPSQRCLLYRFRGGVRPDFTAWSGHTDAASFHCVGDGSVPPKRLQDLDALLDSCRKRQRPAGPAPHILTLLVQHRKGDRLLQQEIFTIDSPTPIPQALSRLGSGVSP